MHSAIVHWKRSVFLLLLLGWGTVWLLPRLSSHWQLEHRQAELLRAIEKRDMRTAGRLVSETYADDWKFDAAAVRLAMDDVAAQFLTLKITAQGESLVRTGDEAVYQAVLRLSGKPIGPLGAPMLQRAAELQKPFVFSWRKEAVWPWSWRLVKVVQPELEVGDGYTPGMFSGHEAPSPAEP